MSRPALTAILTTVAALALLAGLAASLSDARERTKSLREQERDVIAFRQEYEMLKARVERMEGRRGLTVVKGIASAVDELFVPLGLRDKVRSVKPVGGDSKDEERAEVSVTALTTNEAVNVFHSLDRTPMPLVAKRVSMKASFEQPERLNLTLTLAFVSPRQ